MEKQKIKKEVQLIKALEEAERNRTQNSGKRNSGKPYQLR